MFKKTLFLMILGLSFSATLPAQDLVSNLKLAVEKSQGSKCKINPSEEDIIAIYCTNSSSYSVFKLTVENDVIAGTGQSWPKSGGEAECSVEGKVKADEKVKLSIRCNALY
ncbi:hypothetical protein C0V70_01805 [Bacteriovorax stolpii]|uniref:Uncharacterized protein n=1 Tax=Bacteriovorax stolpii TaxID=960 RepID=A0A2K9NMW2_BACTC|nr:hypothetical protein [Bacteriovorax stolpii]AUN96859.1 hypothetical protein C0V70_01805 [Bacteriovorax stolpii]TDP53137.1 hypothetical protein C8D79_1778 [Bacteriovorax stolpii]